MHLLGRALKAEMQSRGHGANGRGNGDGVRISPHATKLYHEYKVIPDGAGKRCYTIGNFEPRPVNQRREIVVMQAIDCTRMAEAKRQRRTHNRQLNTHQGAKPDVFRAEGHESQVAAGSSLHKRAIRKNVCN